MALQYEQQRQQHHLNNRLIDRIIFQRDSKLVTQLLTEHMIKPLQSCTNYQIPPCVDHMVQKAIEHNSFHIKCFVLLLWAYTNKQFRDALFDDDDYERKKKLFARLNALFDAQIRGNAIQCANASLNEPKQFLYYSKKQVIQDHQLRIGFIVHEVTSYFAML